MLMWRSFQLFAFIFIFCRFTDAASHSPRIGPQGSGILIEIEPTADYPDAIAENSLGLACFDTVRELRSFFENRNLPFEQELVRKVQGRKCHIFYEPTVAGFRASPDDEPVEELYTNVDLLKFISKNEKSYGYITDIIKTFMANVSRPLAFHLGISLEHSPEVYDSAIRFHFPESGHRIYLHDARLKEGREWVQDYLKGGSANGKRIILVTRNSYEGDPDKAGLNRSLIESFKTPQFVRSKLSWEGGDLQFVRNPRQPVKMLLFYGGSAFNYWGTNLTEKEYAYVLKLEFGADQAIDFSLVAPHVDYFLSFLPQERIALVGMPLVGDYDVACDALNLLKAEFSVDVPSEILEIEKILYDRKFSSKKVRERLLQAVNAAKEVHADWGLPPMNSLFLAELNKFLATRCKGESYGCFEDGRLSIKAQKLLLEENPDLLRDLVDVARIIRASQDFVLSCLMIIEGQMRELDPERKALRESKVRELQKLGFRVVRMPQIGGESDLQSDWAGISYVNNLVVDNAFFLSIFGLDSLERRLVCLLEKELPDRYQIIPTFAQHMILYNGGIHCLFGIVRRVSE
jgi:hypothetical protein